MCQKFILSQAAAFGMIFHDHNRLSVGLFKFKIGCKGSLKRVSGSYFRNSTNMSNFNLSLLKLLF